MNRKHYRLFLTAFATLALTCSRIQARQSPNSAVSSARDSAALKKQPPVSTLATTAQDVGDTSGPASANAASQPEHADSQPGTAPDAPPKFGSVTPFGSWRFRTEAWDWFQPASGQNSYAFEHSLLRFGLKQQWEKFEWLVEGAQDAILDLPTHAVLPAPEGQLGSGASYFAGNGNGQNNANAFVKQAYLGVALPARGKLRVGRFTFLDGAEVTPKDKSLAVLINTRVTQRLIGDFSFSAVQRSFDGVQLSLNAGNNNFTLLGARPTRGVNQIDAMGELNVDLFYGAYTRPFGWSKNAGQLRLFSVGYVDERGGVLKTDNRPLSARSADKFQIRIATFGGDYAHVFRSQSRGAFDVLVWGALQTGSWGLQAQQASAFVGEVGWQPPVNALKPWFSVGYSYGSGDSTPSDGTHGTFFQILPTPRPYARFPFFNMMNNKDYYGTGVFRLPRSLVVRSELHALKLASPQDLWYLGGGAFQPQSFGYTGRPSGAHASLANVWDVSLDCPLRFGFALTTYYARAWGKSVIVGIYPSGKNAQFGYIETNFRF